MTLEIQYCRLTAAPPPFTAPSNGDALVALPPTYYQRPASVQPITTQRPASVQPSSQRPARTSPRAMQHSQPTLSTNHLVAEVRANHHLVAEAMLSAKHPHMTTNHLVAEVRANHHLVAEAMLSAKHPHMSHEAGLPCTPRLRSPRSIIAGDRNRSLSSPYPKDAITGERYKERCDLHPASLLPLAQSLPPCAWQQPLPARHEGPEGQRQGLELPPPPEACEFKPNADVLKQLELPDVAVALQQAGLTEQLLTAAGLSSEMVR